MRIAAVQAESAGGGYALKASPAILDRRALAAQEALGRALDPHDPAVVRQVAAQMVSELFYVPLLAQMRAFPFGREFGHGGRSEAVFTQQLDQLVGDAVAAADRGGLVDQIVARLEEAARPPGPAAAETGRTDSAAAPASEQSEPARPVGGPPRWFSWLTHRQAHEIPQRCDDDS